MKDGERGRSLSERRGTIYVSRRLPEDPLARARAVERDHRWYGAAPRAASEVVRDRRPETPLW